MCRSRSEPSTHRNKSANHLATYFKMNSQRFKFMICFTIFQYKIIEIKQTIMFPYFIGYCLLMYGTCNRRFTTICSNVHHMGFVTLHLPSMDPSQKLCNFFCVNVYDTHVSLLQIITPLL